MAEHARTTEMCVLPLWLAGGVGPSGKIPTWVSLTPEVIRYR